VSTPLFDEHFLVTDGEWQVLVDGWRCVLGAEFADALQARYDQAIKEAEERGAARERANRYEGPPIPLDFDEQEGE
jgi:hypothetical protein